MFFSLLYYNVNTYLLGGIYMKQLVSILLSTILLAVGTFTVIQNKIYTGEPYNKMLYEDYKNNIIDTYNYDGRDDDF